MKSDLKKETKRIKKDMNLAGVRRKKLSSSKNLKKASPVLTFFPLSDDPEELCGLLNNNLFQLEKDMAYFQFAIKEIKDISRFRD